MKVSWKWFHQFIFLWPEKEKYREILHDLTHGVSVLTGGDFVQFVWQEQDSKIADSSFVRIGNHGLPTNKSFLLNKQEFFDCMVNACNYAIEQNEVTKEVIEQSLSAMNEIGI